MTEKPSMNRPKVIKELVVIKPKNNTDPKSRDLVLNEVLYNENYSSCFDIREWNDNRTDCAKFGIMVKRPVAKEIATKLAYLINDKPKSDKVPVETKTKTMLVTDASQLSDEQLFAELQKRMNSSAEVEALKKKQQDTQKELDKMKAIVESAKALFGANVTTPTVQNKPAKVTNTPKQEIEENLFEEPQMDNDDLAALYGY